MVFCQKSPKKLLRTIAAAMLILAAHDLCQTNGQAAIPEQERNALIDLYNSTNGANWTSNTGWLGEPGTECTWQRVQCDKENTSVIELRLWDMNLAGTLPKTLENLTNLEHLYISSNNLSGSVPSQLGGLIAIRDLNLSYNALYTTDNSLLSFLNSKQADWQKTQTIAPTDISAVAQSSSSILVSWSPVPYVSNTSRYEVYESTTSGGPYAFAGSTHAHSASSLLVTDLKPATTYYFVVRAITYPNGNNRDNTVTSEYSVVAPSRTDAN